MISVWFQFFPSEYKWIYCSPTWKFSSYQRVNIYTQQSAMAEKTFHWFIADDIGKWFHRFTIYVVEGTQCGSQITTNKVLSAVIQNVRGYDNQNCKYQGQQRVSWGAWKYLKERQKHLTLVQLHNGTLYPEGKDIGKIIYIYIIFR